MYIKSVVKFLTRNVEIFQPEVYQQIVDTLLVEKLLHFWVLLRLWLKSYYISGFYYTSGSKVTTFLVLLHFWLFTTFLGLTDPCCLSHFSAGTDIMLIMQTGWIKTSRRGKLASDPTCLLLRVSFLIKIRPI